MSLLVRCILVRSFARGATPIRGDAPNQNRDSMERCLSFIRTASDGPCMAPGDWPCGRALGVRTFSRRSCHGPHPAPTLNPSTHARAAENGPEANRDLHAPARRTSPAGHYANYGPQFA